MRAIEIFVNPAAEVLTLTKREKPVPGETELLINVGLRVRTGPDCLQRQGPIPPLQDVDSPGFEDAREVEAIAPGCMVSSLEIRSVLWWPGRYAD